MLKCLDLFAGAGGLSEGFQRVGFDSVAHIEMDRAACYTLKTRKAYKWLLEKGKAEIYDQYLSGKITRDEFYSIIPDKVLSSVLNYEISKENLDNIYADVDRCLDGKHLSLIIGGPPCQAYSVIGRARSSTGMIGDKRNFLYILYAEFLKRYRPEYFVFENVLGLLSAKDGNGHLYFDKIKELFADCGYSVEYKVLNAKDYGVLQNRKRIILIGVYGDHRNFYPDIKKICFDCQVKEVLLDLPPVVAGGGFPRLVDTMSYHGHYLYDAHLKRINHQPVTLHWARSNSKQDLEIYKIIVDEWNKNKKRINYCDLPARLKTHKNTKAFLDRFKVVAQELNYCQTIVAHISKDGHYYIHPTQNRSLTPREAARLQTFPDDYYFESVSGVPSRTAAFEQVGNAVPVFFAECVAKALKELLQ
ncbi:MAG: DNA (cytosine-5-)-methyltransferase [Lachnospiraceae bacterium]|nr:DNA (cytosine-5-)-methyltransferase [Lachnospiraceae bacterium]